MAAKKDSRVWSKLRVYFRRCRIAALFILLLLVVGAIYVSHSGLPKFLQRPLLDELRARGIDLEFRRLRPRWYRGLVADEVRFGFASTNGDVGFRARSADLMVEPMSLLRGKPVVTRVAIHQGQLDFHVGETNAPDGALRLEGIESSLRLLPDDRWVLDEFRARFAGARFTLSGEITHASAMRDWDLFQRTTPAPAGSIREQLHALITQLETISFGIPPEFRLHLRGDGRDPQSFQARLAVLAADAQTQWGTLTNAQLTAVLVPGTSNTLAHVELYLSAAQTRTPWAAVSGFRMYLTHGSPIGVTNRMSVALQLGATEVVTGHARGTNLQFVSRWEQSLKEPIPLAGEVELRVDAPQAAMAGAQQLRFRAGLSPGRYAAVANPSWHWWTNLAPYRLDWQAEVTGLRATQGDVQRVFLSGLWLAPALVVSNLHADLKDGPVDGSAQLDVDMREATFQVTAAFDAQELRPLLRERSSAWLARFSWGPQPPFITGSGAVILPAWTNRQPDWRGAVLPSLRLAAEVTATNGAYLGVPVDWVHTHVTYTNLIWHLPDLRAGNGPGVLRLEHVADDRTRDYWFGFHSTLDPRLLRPLLSTNGQRGFDYAEFTERPTVAGEVWGRWRELNLIGVSARVAATNFAFRGQRMDSLTTDLHYTNRMVDFLEPRLFRASTQMIAAAGVRLDLEARRVYFTNGFSTAEPQVIANCIGPKTGAGFEPYRFHQPPTVRVEGFAPFQVPGAADLRFAVDGGPFSWWRFNVPHVAGNVRWWGDALSLTKMEIGFYDGRAAGEAHFTFDDRPGTDFQFTMNVTDARLERLMPDVFGQTNHLIGSVSGMLSITNANSADPNSWFGWADCELREGLVWDIPVLGLFSDPVNAITPGLGRSRISEASGRVGITNSVLHFDQLEMRSPLLRLQFRGAVDLTGRIDAIVEAEPLRDTWLIGPLVRITLKPMTKLLEYRITGTLKDPKREPLYLPTRMLFMPLHPFQTLDDILNATSTNAPIRSPRNQ